MSRRFSMASALVWTISPRLRAVNERELMASAGKSLPCAKKSPAKVLGGEDLSKLFGMELAGSTPRAKAALPVKTASVAKVARVPQTRGIKAKAVDTKIKSAKKAVTAKAKPSAPSKSVAKKKPVAAPAKARPVKKSASKARPTRAVARKKPSATRVSPAKLRPASRKGSAGRSAKMS